MSKKKSVVIQDVQRPLLGCHATSANGYCFAAVTAPSDAAEQDFAGQFVRGAAALQTAALLETAERSLDAFGSSLAKGLKIDQFVTRPEAAAAYLAERAKRIATETRPASTHVQVAGLSRSGALIGVQLIAHNTESKKEPIVVPGMPASPGKPFKPAPHAVIQGDFVFITGQVAYDFDEGYPAAAEIDEATWYQSKALNEAKYALGKIERIMKHLGGSLNDVAKLEIYLNDLSDIVDVERVLHDAYGSTLPARSYASTVRLAPSRCRVEITAICRRPGCRDGITPIMGNGPWAAQWIAPAAVAFGGFVFTSTLAGHPASGLAATLSLKDEVELLFERARDLHPDRPANLDIVLFAALQLATDRSMDDLRSAMEPLSGHESVAISAFATPRPLAWARGAVQADFILAL